MGTYFDETDDPRWLSFREQNKKPRYSDIDFWHPQYTDDMRAEIKSMINEFKLDLIKGWWGNGINLSTGEVMKCR